ncbi:hypothetical protein WN48_05364 [Eufriesea mexicana]|nr:hypothetical protein WN48_05364 [Eufriesea mexicana]
MDLETSRIAYGIPEYRYKISHPGRTKGRKEVVFFGINDWKGRVDVYLGRRLGGIASCIRNFRTDFLEEWPTPGTEPYFDTTMQSNFTGLVGKTVHLVCIVKNLGNRTLLAWYRFPKIILWETIPITRSHHVEVATHRDPTCVLVAHPTGAIRVKGNLI